MCKMEITATWEGWLKLRSGMGKSQAMQRRCAAWVLALGMAGCASTGTDSPPAATAEPEKLVADLAMARWDALIKRDFSRAYGYLSPGTRDRVTQEKYAERIRGGTWKKASVDSVTCKQDQCNVKVALEYSYRDMQSIETRLDENWLLQEGKWWFVPRK